MLYGRHVANHEHLRTTQELERKSVLARRAVTSAPTVSARDRNWAPMVNTCQQCIGGIAVAVRNRTARPDVSGQDYEDNMRAPSTRRFETSTSLPANGHQVGGRRSGLGPTEVATAYWRGYELLKSANWRDRMAAENYSWAREWVQSAVAAGSGEAVNLLVQLAKAAPDDVALHDLGAGPVEALVRQHGNQLLDEIDAAAENEPFRTSLLNVWLAEGISLKVRRRLARFSAPRA